MEYYNTVGTVNLFTSRHVTCTNLGDIFPIPSCRSYRTL